MVVARSLVITGMHDIACLSYTINMVSDVVRKREHEVHVELDGGDMQDFSVTGSDTDSDETSSVKIIEHEEDSGYKQGEQILSPMKDIVRYRFRRADSTTNSTMSQRCRNHVTKMSEQEPGAPVVGKCGASHVYQGLDRQIYRDSNSGCQKGN